jgi:hypothetical protein
MVELTHLLPLLNCEELREEVRLRVSENRALGGNIWTQERHGQDKRDKYIMRSFIICTLHKILD